MLGVQLACTTCLYNLRCARFEAFFKKSKLGLEINQYGETTLIIGFDIMLNVAIVIKL